jgi:hypothetical protein
MRARKLLSGTLVALGALDMPLTVRGFGGGPKDDAPFRRSGCDSDKRELVLTFEARRFEGEVVTAMDSPCFAADDAVGAIRCAGSLIGRVGDFGRGLTKPVALRVPVGLSGTGFGLFL